jgi:hypothetical protein
VETEAETELHLGGAGRGQPEGKLGKPRWMVVMMDCREDKRQMVDATDGMEAEAAASLPSCYALRSIHAVHVFPSSHHVFYSKNNCHSVNRAAVAGCGTSTVARRSIAGRCGRTVTRYSLVVVRCRELAVLGGQLNQHRKEE